MDPHALTNFYYNIAVSTLLGSAYGAGYGIYRRTSAVYFAFSTGTSGLLVSTVFFGIREGVVSPLLLANVHTGQFARRRAEFQGETVEPLGPKETLQAMRLYKIPDSAGAGVLTGGALNIIRRGPAGIIPGGVTVGLAAAAVQFLYNELEIARVHYVSHELRSQQNKTEPSQPWPEYMMSLLSYVVPLRKISDEQFVELHERKLQTIDGKLQAVRKELADLDEADKKDT